MPLTTVTDTVQAYLSAVDGITHVYQEMPWTLAGDEWLKNPENGTVAIVHVDDMAETRMSNMMANPGLSGYNGGQKAITYTVRFLMLYQYRIPAQLGGASKDIWSVGLKSLVDAVTARIRSDPSFGCGQDGPIWQAGNNTADIRTVFDMPVNIGPGTVACWTSTEFSVVEIVTT